MTNHIELTNLQGLELRITEEEAFRLEALKKLAPPKQPAPVQVVERMPWHPEPAKESLWKRLFG